MTTQTPTMFLGEFLAGAAFNLLREKPRWLLISTAPPFFSRGDYVYQLPLMLVALSVFMHGVAIGLARRDRPEVLAKLVPNLVNGYEAVESLQGWAKDLMAAHGKEPESFLHFWFHTYLAVDQTDLEVLESLADRKVRLRDAVRGLNDAAVEGIGFAFTFPSESERIWAKTLDVVDDQEWSEIRNMSLAATLASMPLQEAIEYSLARLSEYLGENMPHLLGPLNLHPTDDATG